MVKVRIGIAAAMLGVSTRTLRRWDASGKVSCTRTAGNHRRFSTVEIQAIGTGDGAPAPARGGTAVYCRVSSHEQKAKGDLDRQVAVAWRHCIDRDFGEPRVFTDVGSGLSGKRAGLGRLCDAIERGEVATVVVTFRDRLTRFGFEYLRRYFSSHGARVVVSRQAPTRSMQEELVEDLVAIVTSFSGRVHGMRGRGRSEGRARARPSREEVAFDRAVRRATERALSTAIRNCVGVFSF